MFTHPATYKDKRREALHGSALRYQSPFAQEPWNVDPIDMMTVEEFTHHLVALYGPQYLEPVDYIRRADGSITPPVSNDEKVAAIFRHHPDGLTRLEVKHKTGLANGTVARIVRPPLYRTRGTRGGSRHKSYVWVRRDRV